MRHPRRGPDRPPRGVAGPSTRPEVAGLLASASPEDWQSRSGGAARDADREWSLPDHCGLTASGWCADPHLPRVDVWRSSASYLVLEIGGTIWTSRLCRVEGESVQLNALLLRALIDWADLATRHSPAALQAFQKGQELIIGFVAAGLAAI